MDTSPWIETASIIGTALGAMVLGVVGGRKSQKKEEPTGDMSVVAASITDHRVFRDLTASIEGFREQQHKDSGALRSAIEDMKDALNRNTAAQGQGAVTPHDMLQLIAQMKGD